MAIPPLFPHLVNFEGGSIAHGVNIISQASGRMMEEADSYHHMIGRLAIIHPPTIPTTRPRTIRGHDRKALCIACSASLLRLVWLKRRGGRLH